MPNPRQNQVDTPHFQLPMRFGIGNQLMVHEQDTAPEIIQCIEVLLAVPIGSNRNVPTFGTPDPTFKSSGTSQISADQLKTAILQWEERAAISINGLPILTDELIQQILIRVGTSDA